MADSLKRNNRKAHTDSLYSRIFWHSTVGCSTLTFVVYCFLFGFLFPLHGNIPVVHTCCSYLHRLTYVSDLQNQFLQSIPTVICSRKKSMSSSQFARLCFAAESFEESSCSASSIGYDSITFACSTSILNKISRTSGTYS